MAWVTKEAMPEQAPNAEHGAARSQVEWRLCMRAVSLAAACVGPLQLQGPET